MTGQIKTILGILAGAGSLLAISSTLWANNPKMTTYTVQQGDTLWHILQKHRIDQRYSTSIIHANPHIADPNLLRPGDKLVIPRGNGTLRKLTPKVRRTLLKENDGFNLDKFKPFLSRSAVFSPKELAAAPTVIQAGDRSSHEGRSSFYAQLTNPKVTQYAIVRPMQTYHSPGNKKEILGIEGHYIGEATLAETGHPAKFTITEQTQMVNSGDKLIPSHQLKLPRLLSPQSPRRLMEGQIIATLGDYATSGSYQTVVMNLGKADGLKPGVTLHIMKEGTAITGLRDKKPKIQLPHQTIGKLIVFKTFHRVSYGLILNSQGPVQVMDFVSSAPRR